jgi:hypothetical protein
MKKTKQKKTEPKKKQPTNLTFGDFSFTRLRGGGLRMTSSDSSWVDGWNWEYKRITKEEKQKLIEFLNR